MLRNYFKAVTFLVAAFFFCKSVLRNNRILKLALEFLLKVVRAKVLGFCMGVRRAVETASAALENSEKNGQKKVFTLGPLIHNPLVMDSLEKKARRFLSLLHLKKRKTIQLL